MPQAAALHHDPSDESFARAAAAVRVADCQQIECKVAQQLVWIPSASTSAFNNQNIGVLAAKSASVPAVWPGKSD